MATLKLEVTVLRCGDLAKVQRIGTQDPYVIVRYQQQEFRTKTAKNGGLSPEFKESFVFVVRRDESVLEVVVMNDKRRSDEVIGTGRADFILALEQGKVEKKLPLTSANGSPQGFIELKFKCPDALQEKQISQQVASMHISASQERHEAALNEARAKYYAEMQRQLVPHEAVAGALSEEHLKCTRGIQQEEEKEMAKYFDEHRPKVQELAEEAAREWGDLSKDFVEDFPSTLKEQDPSAEANFAKQISSLVGEVTEADSRRTEQLNKAKAILREGIQEALSKYRGAMIQACDNYEGAFTNAVQKYRTEVKEQLRGGAEAKAREEAARVAPPPPPAPLPIVPPPPPHVPSPPPHAVPPPMPPPVVVVAAPMRPPPTVVYPPVHVAPPTWSAPSPPTVQSGPASWEAQKAQSDAQQAQAAAQRAQQEAEAARMQSAATQAQLQANIERQRRETAMRRGVVGGVLLGRALRR